MSDLKSKGPTTEDINLWHKVVATMDVRYPQRKAAIPANEVKERLPTPKVAAEKGKRCDELTVERLGYANRGDLTVVKKNRQLNIRMDSKKYRQMIRGNMVPEKTIDLHGLRQEQAKNALTDFIIKSRQNGNRLLLVITGKGRSNNYDRFTVKEVGVLRRSVPLWLEGPRFVDMVLQITQAHPKHGGSGAYYVYLKRKKF